MDALIIVDLQNDFMPGGALAVEEGDQVVPLANELAARFQVVVASQDWHPPNHASFASNHRDGQVGETIKVEGVEQMLWPDHCIQETMGAEMHPDLDLTRVSQVVRKGTDPRFDSYSAFFDNGHRKATGLAEWLRERGVEHVTICGLATDYCVKYTALDACGLGFDTCVVTDATRGVERNPGDTERALGEMREAGARTDCVPGLLEQRKPCETLQDGGP